MLRQEVAQAEMTKLRQELSVGALCCQTALGARIHFAASQVEQQLSFSKAEEVSRLESSLRQAVGLIANDVPDSVHRNCVVVCLVKERQRCESLQEDWRNASRPMYSLMPCLSELPRERCMIGVLEGPWFRSLHGLVGELKPSNNHKSLVSTVPC